MDDARLHAIGVIRSDLTSRKGAPKQGSEGAPDAWLEVEPWAAEALDGIAVGDELIVITWLHQARRDIFKVHPRSNPRNPLTGVFATRSPIDRIRLAFIPSSCARSMALGCELDRSKRSTARRSSTSSRFFVNGQLPR